MSEIQELPSQDSPEPEAGLRDANEAFGQPQEDFEITLENAQEYIHQRWDEDGEQWEKEYQETERKHKQELLTIQQKHLHSAQTRLAKLGLADAGRRTLESEIEECNKEIRKLRSELYGSALFVAEEDRLIFRKWRQVGAQAPSGNEVDDNELSKWFRDALDTQDRFFVITLSMFNGINFPDFKDINEILLAEMYPTTLAENRETRTLDSYFEKSDDERFEICRVSVCARDGQTEEIIKFANDNYPNAIFALLRKHYHNLLLDLLPALSRVVQRHRHWEIRYLAAVAAAKIGELSFSRVEYQSLNLWATDKHAYVRAAAGYSLAYLAESRRVDVQNLLNRWSDPSWGRHSELWRYRWTAASTYKQIGLIRQDWARDWAFSGLRRIAGYNDIRLVDAVIHSLIVLSLQGELERTLLVLKEWIYEFCQNRPSKPINRNVQPRYLTALLAFVRLCEIHSADPNTISDADNNVESSSQYRVGNSLSILEKSRATFGDVWQLAIEVGTSSFIYHLEDVFWGLLAFWIEYTSYTTEYQETIINLVTDVFTQLEARDKQLVWNLLRRWEKHSRDKGFADIAAAARADIKKRVL